MAAKHTMEQGTRRIAVDLSWSIACAAAAVLANGYRFGTGDQAIHLTFVSQLLRPGALHGDLVAQHAVAHPSLAWHLLVPLVSLVGADRVPHLFAALYAVALVATFHALIQLAARVHADRRLALAAPALLVVFHFCPGHARTFEPELIPRTLAHPLLLWSAVLLMRGRPGRGAALTGLAFCLHASTAFHTAIALAAAAIADPALRPRIPRMAAYGALCAAPLLALVAAHGGPSHLWVDAEWMQVLAWRLPHHLIPWRWPATVWIVAALQLGLYAAAAATIADPQVRRRCHGMVAGALICGPLMGTLAAGPLRVAPLLGLHLWQAWIWIAVLAYVAAPGLIVAVARRIRPGGRVVAAALAALLLLGLEQHVVGLPRRPVLRPLGMDPSLAAVADLARDAPGPLLVSPAISPWIRVEAGRPLVVTVKDGGEAVFDREMALAWRDRLAQVCGEDILADPPAGRSWLGYRAVRRAAEDALEDRTAAQLQPLADARRAWIVVWPADRPLPDREPIVEHGAYLVYDLRIPSGRRVRGEDQHERETAADGDLSRTDDPVPVPRR